MPNGPTKPVTGYCVEDSGCYLMARVTGNSGSVITQASISTISYGVWDMSTSPPTVVVAAGTSLVVSAVVFDTLQTDARWTRDSTGYCFAVAMPAASFPDGGRTYRVEVKMTPASGAVFHVIFDVEAFPLLTS